MIKSIRTFLKSNKHFYIFVTVVTVFIGVVFTSADFVTAPYANLKDIVILFMQWGIMMIALFTVIYLLSLNRYVFSFFFPILSFSSACLVYFRYTSGTILTTMILDAALDNDIQISLELITPGLLIFSLLFLLISILIVIYRFRKIEIAGVVINSLIAFVLFFVIFNVPRFKNPIEERIPFNLYFISYRYLSERVEALTERPSFNGQIECTSEEDLQVIFVIGESLRFDHLAFNGYERNTTPFLLKEDILSFPNIYSEYTYTNASIPHMLTRADSIHAEYAYTERSFIDLFKKCGFNTIWLANQESAKSYVYFMNECNHLIYANTNRSSYTFDKWTDADLLPLFDQFINEKKKQLIILHTIGSHWYYNAHFPDEFEIFKPTIKSRVVSSNTFEEMINSYDNTVLYTDYFIYQLIERLRDKNSVLIYLSDHGEALGEDGVWLHAVEEEHIHYPACFIWLSQVYKENNMDKYIKLVENRNRRYRTDFLFHTILESANIESDLIDTGFSLFQ